MYRSNRPSSDLFSHRSEPVETSAPATGAVHLPVFSDAVAATPAMATDETTQPTDG
ncbi:hypothetical protein ABZ894_11910 [Nocardia beijingensis]|uniref:hypothetical protein n=1 Tax=Nocardia beijingensis TaxID=95162 RepID=UPI0033D1126E